MSGHVHWLQVYLGGIHVGVIAQDAQGKLSFSYAPSWQHHPQAYPLSLSMPLATTTHGDACIRAYLWGLLPDNEVTLAAWGKRFQVSSRNPFALLSHTGEDCQGAVQLLRAENQAHVAPTAAAVDWIDTAEIERRLADLRHHAGHTRRLDDVGQFSLAGAQPKLALAYDRLQDRWGIPRQSYPTTHILKPPALGSAAHIALNEHVCLRLAREAGLIAAQSEFMRFGSEAAVVIARFDMRLGHSHWEQLLAAPALAGRVNLAMVRAWITAVRLALPRCQENLGPLAPSERAFVATLTTHVETQVSQCLQMLGGQTAS